MVKRGTGAAIPDEHPQILNRLKLKLNTIRNDGLIKSVDEAVKLLLRPNLVAKLLPVEADGIRVRIINHVVSRSKTIEKKQINVSISYQFGDLLVAAFYYFRSIPLALLFLLLLDSRSDCFRSIVAGLYQPLYHDLLLIRKPQHASFLFGSVRVHPFLSLQSFKVLDGLVCFLLPLVNDSKRKQLVLKKKPCRQTIYAQCPRQCEDIERISSLPLSSTNNDRFLRRT